MVKLLKVNRLLKNKLFDFVYVCLNCGKENIFKTKSYIDRSNPFNCNYCKSKDLWLQHKAEVPEHINKQYGKFNTKNVMG